MLRRTKLAAAITTAAVALVGLSVAAGPAAQAATPDHSRHRPIRVVMTNQGFTLPREAHAGFVTFAVSTRDAGGHLLQGIRLHRGVTVAQIIADFRQALSTDHAQAAAGIRAVERDATGVGGAGVEPSTQVDVTLPLGRGTYYFFDLDQFFVPNVTPVFHRFEVEGRFKGCPPPHRAEIDQVNLKVGPRFVVPRVIAPDDVILVRNKGDEIHEAMFQRVKHGVDNADLSRFYDAVRNGRNPGFNPFAESVSRGAAAISPGRSEWVRFHVKRGKYAVQCFVPDDRLGVPHAFLGMHAVTRLVESSR